MKYERLAEQAERPSGSDPMSGETPPEETQPTPGNTGRAGPLLDPTGRKDR